MIKNRMENELYMTPIIIEETRVIERTSSLLKDVLFTIKLYPLFPHLLALERLNV